ncbi:type III pantothenate kinase [Synechococcus sp. CS-602]|uniref:type III pantothenate kinase n=1 Tax=Synechococcaceae TaxID=1890426 RepID=UPI0008FF3752|nr:MULTISPECIES: type III pantothenate kinase [Synechococcaceae]MCT4363897.1 type III pantothenate kinase [Candidatus Regnicoccus frigidus MAG-AL1]APD48400.1 hypothetical protein BM449_09315 [Synechococcus sp. SynAce01]MCT0201289.1 type III pantothenate kinase [Synechococcus sp. CS-603]MCT0205433.1 type III pantothenate kinase [Synechococcus sp. CS-602]MCT0245945.1 type III pantothenate kinase [Synechococcus sp. CS-601]
MGVPGPAPPARWLLIGNSRWHWAEAAASATSGLRCWHSQAPASLKPKEGERLRCWACVGQPAPQLQLPLGRRFHQAGVPLVSMPPWLGVDRALAGWQAWRRQREGAGGAVLVADAGTCLSLTRVDSQGGFAGGRLMAGVQLQLTAMARGTAQLPALAWAAPTGGLEPGFDPWPAATAEAMSAGCLWGLAAAIAQALEAARSEGPHTLWLTGGDGPSLAPLLKELGLDFEWAPELCLEGLVALSPDSDP